MNFSSIFKNTIKNKPYLIPQTFYMFFFLTIWMQYILIPITSTIDKYSVEKGNDPVVVIGLAGFLFLSIWFATTYLTWISSKYTLILSRKIICLWKAKT